LSARIGIGRIGGSSTVRVAAVTALGMLLGLGIDVLIASRLGVSVATDALILGLTVPLFLETVMREGSKFSLVPVMIDKAPSGQAGSRYVSGLINLAGVAGVTLCLLITLASSGLVGLIAPGLGEDALAQARRFLLLSSPMVLGSLIANVLGAYLNSRGVFGVPAARYLVVSVTVLAGAVWVGDPVLMAEAIAVLYGIGYAVYALILWFAARARGLRYSPSSWMSRREIGAITSHLSWPFSGFLAGQSMRIIERSIASTIEPGGVALYYFAFRVFNAIRNIVGMSTAIVRLPGFARVHRSDEHGMLLKKLRQTVKPIFWMIIPLVLVLIAGAGFIVDLVFERGQFGHVDAQRAAVLLRIMVTGLIFFSVAPVLMAALYARSDQRRVFFVMAVTALANLLLALLLVPVLGLYGLAIAFVVSSVVNVGTSYSFIRKG
jgi:putative peptidoglycan lipid II flippase